MWVKVFSIIHEFRILRLTKKSELSFFSGKRCTDPGTPGEAQQVVTNYELGSTLHYTCDWPGFEPDPKFTYTCEYDQNSNTAIWSHDLENNLPVCRGMLRMTSTAQD